MSPLKYNTDHYLIVSMPCFADQGEILRCPTSG